MVNQNETASAKAGRQPEIYRAYIIGATTILTVGLAFMCHELGHVIAGRIAGGTPTLLTAIQVLGDFETLTPAGFIALGISGSLVNLMFCGLGWWGLKQKTGRADFQLAAWFFFTINGLLITTKMMIEPLAGFGDWMTVLNPLPATVLFRILAALVGTAGLVVMIRLSGKTLGSLLPAGKPAERIAQARRIVYIGAAAAAVLVLGSSVANPVGTVQAMLLALGAGLGPFLPMLGAARLAQRTPPGEPLPRSQGGWGWLAAAGIMTFTMWFFFGPGIMLGNILP